MNANWFKSSQCHCHCQDTALGVRLWYPGVDLVGAIQPYVGEVRMQNINNIKRKYYHRVLDSTLPLNTQIIWKQIKDSRRYYFRSHCTFPFTILACQSSEHQPEYVVAWLEESHDSGYFHFPWNEGSSLRTGNFVYNGHPYQKGMFSRHWGPGEQKVSLSEWLTQNQLT